ncbi:hypothetical protein BOTNAR_0589g00010 [Botryotinia narcissicola]|uniref:2EXR domain-containing protein n=1 Tax=Botryotinia narcissicola TaxID=278944 RepID=A0A4Z1HGJ1_9HELO|nr:hypothetical protein BOTNAR_0589g00010 [Botryotinia narcissicola]
MAGLTIPSGDSGKDQMLECYLNLMAEQSEAKARGNSVNCTSNHENTHETQEVSKNSREHEEWKESRTESQDTYWNLLDLGEETGTNVLFAKGSHEIEKLQGKFQQPLPINLRFSVKSIGSPKGIWLDRSIIATKTQETRKKPRKSGRNQHTLTFQAGLVLFDLEEGISYATALSSSQKAQETDGIQEAEYNQDTEGTGESEADPEEDDQWWGISDLKKDSAPPRILHLRRQIWNFARPEARYIKIRESKWSAALYSDAPMPSLLHTFQESRKAALKWYDLSFAMDPEMGFWDQRTLTELMDNAITEGQRAQPRIYFDWERDGIYSQCAHCNGHRMSCRHAPLSFDWLRVKRLAYEGPLSINPFYKLTLCYPVVESIILIRGRSAVRRTAVSPSEFIPVDEKFEWEGDDLLATCLETIQNTDPECDALETITSVQRMTLMDVKQTEVVDRTESSYWPCR